MTCIYCNTRIDNRPLDTYIYMFIIYSKERKKKTTAVTHTHNTEINYLYTRLLSYTNTFTQEKKKHGINI